MITKENKEQWKALIDAAADGELQRDIPCERWKSDQDIFTSNDIKLYRRKPRKVTRPMTVFEVVALGMFVVQDKTGRLFSFPMVDDSYILIWIHAGHTWSNDGGKTWHPFTVEEYAK